MDVAHVPINIYNMYISHAFRNIVLKIQGYMIL